ncbi:MAG: HD domain-containing protein [Bdellovibrionaceae bacterium]|nr:HD domain-containing protein [Pseudobdellovibrionaceae bacterium]
MEVKSYIHDPIHGHIFLTPVERWVVDTLEFQRLRFIRQNSLLHYVFPGAFHTRFAHSLGVCHVAHRISKQLIHWVNEPEIYYPMQVYRLACLLHDVGHGAFSHTLTYVKFNGRSFLPTLNEVLDNYDVWGVTTGDFIYNLMAQDEQNSNEPIEHEYLSLLIIQRVFKNIPEKFLEGFSAEQLANDVASMVENKIVPSEYFLSQSQELFTGALKSIPCLQNDYESGVCIGSPNSFHKVLSSLVSGTIDADRMDYLLRDSQTFGVNYGLFDFEGILSSLSLVIDDGKFSLGLNAKRINTLDDYLWSRYQMFKQIYCHKTHVAYNLLLNFSMQELTERGELKAPQNLDEYLHLTDDYVMGKVFHAAQLKPHDKGKIQDFAARNLPKFLGVFEASVADPVWKKNKNEIFIEAGFGKEAEAVESENLHSIVMKVEVVKKSGSQFPIVFSFDKRENTYVRQNYLSKSVFFNQGLQLEKREEELSSRLNKKLIYFFS